MVRIRKRKKNEQNLNLLKIDFSLKREVFYVVIGSILGAIAMEIPKMIYDTINDIPYYIM
jgi:ribosomal protein L18E